MRVIDLTSTRDLIRKLWNDEAGYVVSVELVLVGTVLGIGMVTGLTMLRDSVLAELGDVAGAFGSLDQSFGIPGISYNSGLASTASSAFVDGPDAADLVSQSGVNLPQSTGLVVVNGTIPDASANTSESGT
jgi:hypothetical protein